MLIVIRIMVMVLVIRIVVRFGGMVRFRLMISRWWRRMVWSWFMISGSRWVVWLRDMMRKGRCMIRSRRSRLMVNRGSRFVINWWSGFMVDRLRWMVGSWCWNIGSGFWVIRFWFMIGFWWGVGGGRIRNYGSWRISASNAWGTSAEVCELGEPLGTLVILVLNFGHFFLGTLWFKMGELWLPFRPFVLALLISWPKVNKTFKIAKVPSYLTECFIEAIVRCHHSKPR